jgi:hypothetical protein
MLLDEFLKTKKPQAEQTPIEDGGLNGAHGLAKKKKKKKKKIVNSKDYTTGGGHLEIGEEYEDDIVEKEMQVAFKPKRNYDVPSTPISPAMVTPNVITDYADFK